MQAEQAFHMSSAAKGGHFSSAERQTEWADNSCAGSLTRAFIAAGAALPQPASTQQLWSLLSRMWEEQMSWCTTCLACAAARAEAMAWQPTMISLTPSLHHVLTDPLGFWATDLQHRFDAFCFRAIDLQLLHAATY